MRNVKLTPSEKKIDNALVRGEYRPVSKRDFDRIVQAIAARKKNAVLNLRVNRVDLDIIKQKAKSMGVKYQSLVSELLHHFALGMKY